MNVNDTEPYLKLGSTKYSQIRNHKISGFKVSFFRLNINNKSK